MLCLTRRQGETIMIGHDIRIVVLQVEKHQISIGIEAPHSVRVHPEEIYLKVQEQLSPDRP